MLVTTYPPFAPALPQLPNKESFPKITSPVADCTFELKRQVEEFPILLIYYTPTLFQ